MISKFCLLIALVLLGSVGCSKVGFSQNENSKVGKEGDPDPEVILKNCVNAAKNGTLKSSQQIIKFEDTAIETGKLNRHFICEFEQNDNLAMKDSFMQARYEQEQTLALPANAVICDVALAADLQSFSYDDIFFFSFNGQILATNNKTQLYNRINPESQVITSNGTNIDLFTYDWLKLRGASFANVADDYCFGESEGLASCSWPITEQSGNIVLEFDQELMIQLGLLAPANSQIFKFVITGDNDPTIDCYHEKLELKVDVKYYLK